MTTSISASVTPPPPDPAKTPLPPPPPKQHLPVATTSVPKDLPVTTGQEVPPAGVSSTPPAHYFGIWTAAGAVIILIAIALTLYVLTRDRNA